LQEGTVSFRRRIEVFLGPLEQLRQVCAWGEGGNRLGDLGRGGEPLLRLLRQHAVEHLQKTFGYVGAELFQRGHRLLHVRQHLLHRVAVLRPTEGRTAGQQLVERAAQRVHVGADVDRVAVEGLLGGHVVGRAHRLAFGGQLARIGLLSAQPGEAEVEDLYCALTPCPSPEYGRGEFRCGPSPGGSGEIWRCPSPGRRGEHGEHQVCGLDVAVDESVLVDGLQAQRRLVDDRAGVGHAETAETVDDFAQVEPLGIFHHQDRGAFDVAGVQRLHDVGMADAADGLHFPLEAGPGLGVGGPLLGQDLDGHDLVEPGLPGLVDRTHAAFTQLLQKLILAQAPELGERGFFSLDRNRGGR
jgi:hypothetical protein